MARNPIAWMVLVVISVVAVGCSNGVSQQDYQRVKADLAQAQQALATANSRLSDTQETLASTQSSLSDTQSTLSTVRGNLSDTQSALNSLKVKCPPGDFSTVSSLESWVASHVQPLSTYADQWFRGALRVQEAGLNDGYLISIDIDYDTTTTFYTIGCNAIAGGQLYYWNPEQSTIYSWSDVFRR